VNIAGIIVLLLFLGFVSLGVLATVRTVRATRRSMARAGAQARRVVEDTQIKARRYTTPGPAGRLAQLRLDLRTSIDSTFRALGQEHAHDSSLSEASALLARLNDHARALDHELKLLEREPDRDRLSALLPDLTTRTQRITRSADSLRWAAQDRAHQFADDDLTDLTRQIDIEAGALRHWEKTPPPPKLSPSGE
jgi:hypothetical protein